ncbi:hypothetical protein [Sphingobacterium anhuiense]|uniref:hypothetical protein n=1 Tax=Sphingobacterium anhuiense TaxID=493780 RepID=UPI003C2E6447
MEQYEHFCAISKYLYGQLEIAATMIHTLNDAEVDCEYWEHYKLEMLHKIEVHFENFERVLFEKENVKNDESR